MSRRHRARTSEEERIRQEGACEIVVALCACPAVMQAPEVRDEILKLAVGLGLAMEVRT